MVIAPKCFVDTVVFQKKHLLLKQITNFLISFWTLADINAR